MNYKITEVFLDMAEKYRVRVIIDEVTKETFFFRFNNYPTQQEVNTVVSEYLSNLEMINNEPTQTPEEPTPIPIIEENT